MKKVLWIATHLSGNYNVRPDLTALIYRCIELIKNCSDVSVRVTEYDIVIKTKSSSIVLWNANKFYAWLSNGTVNGVPFNNGMPSKSAMYDFKECLKKHGYNIYVKEPKTIVDVSNLSPYRETHPEEMLGKPFEELAPLTNIVHTNEMKAKCSLYILAYGNPVIKDMKPEFVDDDWQALKLTKSGNPGHPLYLKSDLKPFYINTPTP